MKPDPRSRVIVVAVDLVAVVAAAAVVAFAVDLVAVVAAADATGTNPVFYCIKTERGAFPKGRALFF